jgi:hypothetical protein
MPCRITQDASRGARDPRLLSMRRRRPRASTYPCSIAVARFDPAVAPPCQFSVANALPTSNIMKHSSWMRAISTILAWRSSKRSSLRKSGVLQGGMRRDYRRWYSPRLHRDMELLIFGHAGAKVLMFPTRDGRFWEYEQLNRREPRRQGQCRALQLYCIEGLARETFYDRRPASGRPHPPPRRLRGLHPPRGAAADGLE